MHYLALNSPRKTYLQMGLHEQDMKMLMAKNGNWPYDAHEDGWY